MKLKFGVTFEDLNNLVGINKIDTIFLNFLEENKPVLVRKLQQARLQIYEGRESALIIELAYLLDDFLAELFGLQKENFQLMKKAEYFDPIYECRRKFVQRYAVKQYPRNEINKIDFAQLSNDLKLMMGSEITQDKIASLYFTLARQPEKNSDKIELLAKYCAVMVAMHSKLMLFDVPRAVDPSNHIRDYKIKQLAADSVIGFNYRDKEISADKVHGHTKYCIYCHNQQKDSCSKGLDPKVHKDKNGCPLKQKISEMNFLKSKGYNIASLAVIIIDNPMVAATGHRICNDCMKSCIYQKQTPVNIPLIETDILNQVLSLPWGVELYLLLTKWNPLNFSKPYPSPNSGYKILVTGLGPAGFALSHYLLNDGHKVTAIDGLKISPLEINLNKPIKWWKAIKSSLSKRQPQGFGGVAEYGITNRWDKNNLTLIRLALERRSNFSLCGGVRLGSNITVTQAFENGFDHISLCLGAGKPGFENLPGYFAKNVRTASDFLMNLQQGGAFLEDSNSSLQIRLPAVVIGGGLTAIDSAVEIIHYYIKQVHSFAANYDEVKHSELSLEEREIAAEFIKHSTLLDRAKDNIEIINIIRTIGGVKICYRKSLKESPAYRLNPEEIEHAESIGVEFLEYAEPQEIITDDYGSAEQILFKNGLSLNAKTVLVAIGTEENEFQDINIENSVATYRPDIFKNSSRTISYFGDCNQKYSGNVVKALASAKNGYGEITEALRLSKPKEVDMIDNFKSHIHQINKLSDNIVELIVYSPWAVRNFKPGQFFKLQNFSNNLAKIMEPIALTGAYVDIKNNHISLIILEMGASSRLCRYLEEGREISLMGPTGMPTELPADKNVTLIGGGLGNAVLIAIGNALKARGCKIIYIAGYKLLKDRFYPQKIEEFSDHIIWACEEGKLTKHRDTDLVVKGNIINALRAVKSKGLCSDVEYVICIGSDRMMAVVSQHKREFFNKAEMICSINSPMQCMMKGICGQCIQQINNDIGYIFTCTCQDQPTDKVDFICLNNKLKQNSLLEKINA